MYELPLPPIPTGPIVDATRQLTAIARVSLQRIRTWVGSGFVVIPCVATGTNVISLTPILLSTYGSSGWTHGLTISFVAAASSTGPVTIVLGTLTAVKAYVGATATQADNGDVVKDVAYLGIYCDAVNSEDARVVLK